jgi:integrase
VQSTAVTPSGSGRPGVAVTLLDTRETLSHVGAPCQSIDETPDRCGAVAVEEARVAEGLEGRVLAGPLARAAGMGQAQHDHDVHPGGLEIRAERRRIDREGARLHLFKRAIRLGLVTVNPVKGIPKLKESGGRIVYLPPATKDRPAYEETALLEALPPEIRPLFTVSLHTGLRWSEQMGLKWRDVDMLTGLVGVGRSKNGYGRQVPMNTTVQSVLLEMATQRKQTNDPMEPVFVHAYRTVARAFKNAIQRAQGLYEKLTERPHALTANTWHGNRHSFASRLVMVGVDLLTVQKLGGWRTLSMVQRYGHLAPTICGPRSSG